MNAVSCAHLVYPPDPEVWEEAQMRDVLMVRDVTELYRGLQKCGYSQQKIAAMVGQSQPEVSAVIHGRRVIAYDVLDKIAHGLGIPRGYMGLAYAEETGDGCACERAAGPG